MGHPLQAHYEFVDVQASELHKSRHASPATPGIAAALRESGTFSVMLIITLFFTPMEWAVAGLSPCKPCPLICQKFAL